MNDFEKMRKGLFYNPEGESIYKAHEKGLSLQQAINRLPWKAKRRRAAYMRKLISQSKGDIAFYPPFHCEYGCNIVTGKNFFMNFNCTILDVATVTIGDNVMFGANVTIATPVHPLIAEERQIREYPDGYHDIEYARPVVIEDGVWLASNVTVAGGVTIGSGSVIAAGSVVTRNVPSGVLAGGIPCRVIRPITEEDRMDPWNTYLAEKTPTRGGK